MTPEAEKFLQKLAKQGLSKIYQWIEEKGKITSVKLKQSALTDEEIDKAFYHAKNGAPEITVEWRAEDDPFHTNGISAPFIFIDEASTLKKSDPDHFYDALKYNEGKIYYSGRVVNKPGKGFSLSEALYWPTVLNRSRLMEDLLRAEKEEDYQLCSAIMKCADENGIDLKRTP